MSTSSFLNLKVAFAQLRPGVSLTFTECMVTELRILSRIVRSHDVHEGVRTVIATWKNPDWRPATLAAARDAEVERHFVPLGKGDVA